MNSFRSVILFEDQLPSLEKLAQTVGVAPGALMAIYDRKLTKQGGFETWLKGFSKTYPVAAGEKLKDVDAFPKHLLRIQKILDQDSSRESVCFVSVGGGSVGDFVGFLASVFKRGVKLVHLPTTFLAAIDSAHGGKTALNVGGIKNQIGTFYPAQAVVIVKDALKTLPPRHLRSALGELTKMALLVGKDFLRELDAADDGDEMDLLWRLLPQAIEGKLSIVEKDPHETMGQRKLLNLGHTLGHCLEAAYGIEHGEAVALGLAFALNWSHHRGHLSQENLENYLRCVQRGSRTPAVSDFFKKRRQLSRSGLKKYVIHDKKLVDRDHLSFVFLEKAGRAFVKTVSLESFLTEAERQKWIRP